MRRIEYGLVVIGLLGGILAGTASAAGAGVVANPDWIITDAFDGYVDVFEMDLVNEGEECDSDTTVRFLDDGGLIGQAPLSGTNSGTVVVPDDLSSTTFDSVEVTCTIDGNPFTVPATVGQGDFFIGEYAGLDVTKVVDGDAPAGTEFVIQVDCESPGSGEPLPDAGPYDLVFDADGGTNRVWFSNVHTCELTETDDGGADSSTIVSEDCGDDEGQSEIPIEGNGAELVAIVEPVQCDATVTNVFSATPTTAAPTTAAPTTAQPDSDVAPAGAAQPTKANPTFTG